MSGAAQLSVSAREPRALGVWMCTALIVGNVIGIGIFVMPAALAPYGLNALTGWLITVLGCTFLAITFSVLARAFPQDDGPYGYTKRAFGDGTAFIVMWCYWVSAWVTNATIAIGVVGYLMVFVPALKENPWLPPLTAMSLLWLFVLINLRGARTAGWVQVLTTVLKVMPLLGVICLGFWLLLTHPSAYSEHVPSNPPSVREVSSVSTIALFAMLGIECAMIPACRVRDPRRTIPLATVMGSVFTALIYICVSIVPMLLIPQQELAASNAPFADLFARVLGAPSGEVLAVFVIISGLGALNGWTLMTGEVTQGLARHGRFPALLAKENAHGAPTLAFILSGVIASAMLLTNYNQSVASGFAFMSVVVTAGNLPLYFACSLAIVVLGRRGRIARPGGLAYLWAAAALCAAAYCVWVSIGIGLKPLVWTLALGAVAVPVYIGSHYLQRRAAEAVP
ncbi:MAG: APC family permease [Steroidobacteraceae bacterium]